MGLDFDRTALKPSRKEIQAVKQELDMRMNRLEAKVDRLLNSLRAKI